MITEGQEVWKSDVLSPKSGAFTISFGIGLKPTPCIAESPLRGLIYRSRQLLADGGSSLPKVAEYCRMSSNPDNLLLATTMNERFLTLIASLEPKFQQLLALPPLRYSSLPRQLPRQAIYLFSESDKYLYVGRTNRLRERLRGHCTPSATHYTATFAFRIAREATGMIRASYASEGSRANLVNDSSFGLSFAEAKRRVANMDIRFVEETNPVKQALLEIYTATTLSTPYNDFDNH